jgi:hypothetical protein
MRSSDPLIQNVAAGGSPVQNLVAGMARSTRRGDVSVAPKSIDEE